MSRYLSDFCPVEPPYKKSQKELLEILAALQGDPEKVARFSCKPSFIGSRNYFCEDFLSLQKLSLKERMEMFQKHVSALFEQLYHRQELPQELIHVTCTGYQSPSAAQIYVAKRGGKTRVLHAYHMGCLAALPAVRMAFASSEPQVDIVHTELSSLHLNTSLHSPDQIIAQSLFADGAIRYRVKNQKPGWKLVAIEEVIIPDTQDFMTWSLESWGFKMTLHKGIPVAIAASILPFTKKLLEKAESQTPFFAIHPGGPKIIEAVGEKLGLAAEQLRFSQEVFYERGNMSSATLPHIWRKIDEKAPSGSEMISLAFGPGLTLSGMLLKKET